MSDKEVDELIALADLVTPMAIRAAATLRVVDRLDEPRRAADIAAAAGADPDALDRLMRHLVTIGVLSRDDAGRYTPTARGVCLRDDHPAQLRGDWDADGSIGRADLSAMALPHSIRTGAAAFPELYGTHFWADLSADPARGVAFDDQRGDASELEAPRIVSAYDWGALGDLMDVGGGNGTLLIALLNEYPALRGTVLELPGPAESARKLIDAAGLADRADVVAGDFRDGVPAGAEGYLLSAILHSWNDADARQILSRCAQAAGQDGAVFVIERVGAAERTHADLRNLAWFGGKVRDTAQLTALAESAALAVASTHTDGDLVVLELRTT
jgi:O-methyltransferase